VHSAYLDATMTNSSIAILLPDLRGGGAERVNIDLAHEFALAGHEVEFVLMQAAGEFLPAAQVEFRVFDLGVTRTRGVPAALARYLRERKPDAIIANMWPLTSAAVIGRALSGHQCRLLLMEHNTLSQQYSSWGRIHSGMMATSMAMTYRFADLVAAVSEGAAKDTARLAFLSNDRVKVLHNPIPQRHAPSPEAMANAEVLWSGPKGARIVTVGSMKAQKNHPLLLRAFVQLDRPEARLIFVGDGAGRDAILALAQDLGVADRVILAGFHSDPTPFYKTADLFVLASDYEGFGNVIVEALACGTPVVSTDCPSGPGEILDGGRFGRLVRVGDAGAMAEAIQAALNAPADSDALTNRAADFAPAKAAEQYLRLLR